MLGRNILVLLCAGPTLLLTPVARRPTTSQPATPSKQLPSPTGQLNLGFLLRENLLLCSSYLFSWGSQQCNLIIITTSHSLINLALSKIVWRRCTHQDCLAPLHTSWSWP